MISQRQCLLSDRFIPLRKQHSLELLSSRSQKSSSQSQTNQSRQNYIQMIKNSSQRLLQFKKKPKKLNHDSADFDHSYSNPFERLKTIKLDIKFIKKINFSQAFETKDIVDDFHYNILDCSKDQLISVAVQNQIHLINLKNKKTDKLNVQDYIPNYFQGNISSLKFNNEGNFIYFGFEKGAISIYDLQKQKYIRNINDVHLSRVGCIQNTYDWGIVSGSKDKSIIHHDIRVKNSNIFKVMTHKQEVCGLSVIKNRVASSSTDGKIYIWSLNEKKEILQHHSIHKDRVKSIKWCPWKSNLLASGGGGKKDHKIILWNSETQKTQMILQGNTPIMGLQWNDKTRDLICAHVGNRNGGYMSVWNYQIKNFTHLLLGHYKRIIGMKINLNNKNQVISIGADQILKVWNVRKQNQQYQNVRRQSTSARITENISLK